MVELVTVMVLLGILSAIMVPRMLSDPGMAGSAFRADILTALRYAQKTAVSHRRVVWATLNNNSLILQIATTNPAATDAAGACLGAPLPPPDNSSYSSTSATASYTTLPPPLALHFQPNGEITTDCTGATLANQTIVVTAANQNEPVINIVGVTGHVD